jgi:2-amino-4-hydroxy-6-hydroxymethyldihydropteridine diphosphokinase
MTESHLAYLNLGSNIQPETNLLKAVELLSSFGEIIQHSQVWESEPVGTKGKNYLNVCIQFKTSLEARALKDQVIHPIENQLGRERGPDKFAPRSMDIDIIPLTMNAGNWLLSSSRSQISIPISSSLPLASLFLKQQHASAGKCGWRGVRVSSVN